MRAYIPAYDLQNPKSLKDALAMLGQGYKPFAGGTDLMVLLEAGKLFHTKYFSLWHLEELQGIEENKDLVTIGARATYSQIQANALIRREFPMLVVAGSETGAVAIQNRGTIGGNIANASPAADTPPALLAYGAELELVSLKGSRWIPYDAFHLGYKKTALGPDELIARVRVPRPTHPWSHQHYRKVGTRKAQAISKVCFAGLARFDDETLSDVRIVLGSVAPTVLRCARTEAVIRGKKLDAALIAQARAEIALEVTPIDDIRSTAEFRREVTANLLEEFLCGIGSASSRS